MQPGYAPRLTGPAMHSGSVPNLVHELAAERSNRKEGRLGECDFPASGAKVVRVRLELFDTAGSAIASFNGKGRKSEGCCPFVAFGATSSGSLVIEEN
jgi:hypothetical protein